MNSFMLEPDDCVLLAIDIQERLHQAMQEDLKPVYVKNGSILIKTAKAVSMPVVVSEQYPRGLGSTIPEISAALGETPRLEKLYFSCWRDLDIHAALDGTGRDTVILTGIETHVCVLQTALDMLEAGWRVAVATDAVCSRHASDRTTGIAAMAAAGAFVYSTETIAFMLMEKAGTPVFKEISPLFR